jgi:2'-5' RNA ligase
VAAFNLLKHVFSDKISLMPLRARVPPKKQNMSRLFLAIPLPWEVKQTLWNIQDKVKEQMKHSRINWVESEQFHITLHFLGEVSEEVEDELVRRLKSKEWVVPFELKLAELTAFPDKKHPYVLCVKTNMHSGAFGLYKRTGDVIASLGLPIDEHTWEPHITFGRIKVQSEVLKPELVVVPPLKFEINKFVLMSSVTYQEGSRYDVVEEFELGSFRNDRL